MLRLSWLKTSKNKLSVPCWYGGTARPDVAARARVLDLDHVGAQLGQVHRSERPGPVLLARATMRKSASGTPDSGAATLTGELHCLAGSWCTMTRAPSEPSGSGI